jgi:hypothetical protein
MWGMIIREGTREMCKCRQNHPTMCASRTVVSLRHFDNHAHCMIFKSKSHIEAVRFLGASAISSAYPEKSSEARFFARPPQRMMPKGQNSGMPAFWSGRVLFFRFDPHILRRQRGTSSFNTSASSCPVTRLPETSPLAEMITGGRLKAWSAGLPRSLFVLRGINFGPSRSGVWFGDPSRSMTMKKPQSLTCSDVSYCYRLSGTSLTQSEPSFPAWRKTV